MAISSAQQGILDLIVNGWTLYRLEARIDQTMIAAKTVIASGEWAQTVQPRTTEALERQRLIQRDKPRRRGTKEYYSPEHGGTQDIWEIMYDLTDAGRMAARVADNPEYLPPSGHVYPSKDIDI